jgi:hypothetical protein
MAGTAAARNARRFTPSRVMIGSLIGSSSLLETCFGKRRHPASLDYNVYGEKRGASGRECRADVLVNRTGTIFFICEPIVVLTAWGGRSIKQSRG